MIPKIIHHFRYDDGNYHPFGLMHYLSIKSSIVNHKNYLLKIHTNKLPNESTWYHLLLKEFPSINWLVDINEYDSNKYDYVSHYLDKIRLDVLISEGGFSIDSDSIFLDTMEDYFEKYDCVTELQYHPVGGNRTGIGIGFLAANISNNFILKYAEFNSKYEKGYEWGRYCVDAAYEAYKLYPQEVYLLPPLIVDPFTCRLNELKDLFLHNKKLSYLTRCIHISESQAWDNFLKNLTIEHIMTVDTTFTKAVRYLIDENIWDFENKQPLITFF